MMNMTENGTVLKLTERQLARRIPVGEMNRDFGQYEDELNSIYAYVSLAASVREEGDRMREQGRTDVAKMKHSKADKYVKKANIIAIPIGIEII